MTKRVNIESKERQERSDRDESDFDEIRRLEKWKPGRRNFP